MDALCTSRPSVFIFDILSFSAGFLRPSVITFYANFYLQYLMVPHRFSRSSVLHEVRSELFVIYKIFPIDQQISNFSETAVV